jgi:hypothetical protein
LLAFLFTFFIISGYMAAFVDPERVANQWEAACGFTFVVLVLIGFYIYMSGGPRGKHG